MGLGGRNSADLAVRLRNPDPKAKYTYQLVTQDDECKPNIGVQVATKVAADKSIVAGVTHYCSAVAMATVGVYHRFGMPAIVWGAVLPEVMYANNFKDVHCVNGTMINQNEVVDEPSLGLSPLFVKENFRVIRQINELGITVLLVEQNARQTLAISHYGYVLSQGRVVAEGTAKALSENDELRPAYFG